ILVCRVAKAALLPASVDIWSGVVLTLYPDRGLRLARLAGKRCDRTEDRPSVLGRTAFASSDLVSAVVCLSPARYRSLGKFTPVVFYRGVYYRRSQSEPSSGSAVSPVLGLDHTDRLFQSQHLVAQLKFSFKKPLPRLHRRVRGLGSSTCYSINNVNRDGSWGSAHRLITG